MVNICKMFKIKLKFSLYMFTFKQKADNVQSISLILGLIMLYGI